MTDDATRTPKPPPVDRMSLLWQRINEHKIVQWSVAYVALAYAIQHAVVLTQEAFHWPENILRISMLLLALGLPIVVTFAWYQGERASRHFSKAELSILSALLVIGAFLFYTFARPADEHTASTPAEQHTGVTAARSAATDPRGAISLAVLPFVNLSSDKEQEFFSDGMTEEITTALAKVPDLRVVGRTSAFQFKGDNKDLRTIGQSLSATHLIEGSVRKAGNRVRITAQLIKADDGTHLWAEDYDRELTDVFAIQEDIARAITVSLHMTLGLKPGENLVKNRAIDPESYEKYLRARSLFAQRQVAGPAIQATLAAIPLFESVVAANPSYAPAWAYLSGAYATIAQIHAQDSTEPFAESKASVTEMRAKGEAAAQKAVAFDPEEPGAYTMLGLFAWGRGKMVEADGFLQKALTLNPDAEQLTAIADRFADSGRLKDALALADRAHALDPLIPQSQQIVFLTRWLSGDTAGALTVAKNSPRQIQVPLQAAFFASQNRFREAADTLAEIARDPNSATARAVQLLRNRQTSAAAGDLPSGPGLSRFLYPGLGAWDRLLLLYEREFDTGYVGGRQISLLWPPAYSDARKSDLFKRVVRKVGLVEYWHAKGWPPQCHPTTGDDFACE